ncbi:hypothetical protein [Cellulomonas endometrii]|uniref:hypothetical protein n=1 Tax=Cellulomonas endometrii TaxID=3036301 RepID=UPI0024ADDAFA|nr:hypothetical protein [Cellulomonas endometrii]
MADVTEVAAELYGVAPAGFTAARTAAVRAARAAGDTAVATAVGALRKPSAAAAAVNLLVRERPQDVGRLLDLGVRLREAQAALSGTDLRALHAEQQRTMTEVVQVAVDLLAEAGGTVGAAARGQVEATLRAAMGDPDAAAAVATGLLVRDLFSSGFEPVDVDGAVAVPDAPPLAGAPARRTPMRAVPAERERPDTAPDDGAGGSGRRRGRLITADEPDRPVREVPPARARGRVRTAGTGDQEAPPDAPREHTATRRRTGSARTQSAGTGSAGTRRAREAEERRAREAEDRRAREAAQAAERERRREAARRSAEEDLALARQDAQEQRAARDAADRRLRDAEARQSELADLVERTQQEIARLRDELAVAEQEARETGLEVRHARSARTTAARAAERAESRLRAAETHLDGL